MICPYCCSTVSLVDSIEVYIRSYGLIYLCDNRANCDARVGVHKGTDKPLGRLADRELRDLKKECHALFDPIWNGNYTHLHA